MELSIKRVSRDTLKETIMQRRQFMQYEDSYHAELRSRNSWVSLCHFAVNLSGVNLNRIDVYTVLK